MTTPWRSGALLFSVCMAFAACSDDEPTGADNSSDAPVQGSERGACYPNMTCDAGLVCASDLCVMSPAEDMSTGVDGDMSTPGDLDMGVVKDMSVTVDMVTLPDMPTGEDMPVTEDMPVVEDMPPVRDRVMEMEPNDGAMLDEINMWPLESIASGVIATPGDADVWRIDVPTGQIYTVRLTTPAGSTYQEHLTVIDAGRGNKSPGDDYVKIAQRTASSGAALTFVTMGEGGYFVAVRDARDVGEDAPVQGSATHTYEMSIDVVELSDVTASVDVLGGRVTGALSEAGALDIYPFTTAAPGAELRADLRANSDSMDARMIVYSVQEQGWIARQDNRSAGDSDPLLDAPLFGEGQMWLIVENVTPESTMLGYSLDVTLAEP